jgi:pentatricopeptide repeat protein
MLRSINNLVNSLSRQGKYTKAETLNRQTLKL